MGEHVESNSNNHPTIKTCSKYPTNHGKNTKGGSSKLLGSLADVGIFWITSLLSFLWKTQPGKRKEDAFRILKPPVFPERCQKRFLPMLLNMVALADIPKQFVSVKLGDVSQGEILTRNARLVKWMGCAPADPPSHLAGSGFKTRLLKKNTKSLENYH